jgi:hypothetical protein
MRVIRFASALWILCAPGFATAVMPVGNYEIAFGGNHSIWFGDGSGDDNGLCDGLEAGVDLVGICNFQLFVDGKGKVFGDLDFGGWDDGFLITFQGPIKGTLRGDARKGIARTSYSLKVTGEADDGSVKLPVKGKLKFTGQVEPGGVATGVWEQRFCTKGSPCVSSRIDLLPENLTNGDWLLELTIADAEGGALDGSALVRLGNGTECPYDLSGKYSAKTDLASLVLIPSDPLCAGTSIQLKNVRALDAVELSSAQVKYKLFGYAGEASWGAP